MISIALTPPVVEELLSAARQKYQAGELALAEQLCRQVLQASPRNADAVFLLGAITQRLGGLGLAIGLFRRAIALQPEDPTFHQALGDGLRILEFHEDATSSYWRSLHLCRENPKALNGLGLSLLGMGKTTEAIAHIECALGLNPDYAKAHKSLSLALLRQGRVEEAVASLRRALALRPDDSEANSNLLFTLHYLPTCTAQMLADESRVWGERHAEPLKRFRRPHTNRPDPARRLRIGYVSGDFHEHPVARFFQSVISNHRPDEVEVFCYHNHRLADEFTQHLREAANHWRTIADQPDERVADRIREDEIDILVDLSGHTGWNRLKLFAHKPAPVQATWLGYFNTTGVRAIDYVIADPFVCPTGSDELYAEKVVRLPHGFLCYAPPSVTAKVSPLPAASRGYVTFGCFNGIAKVSSQVVEVWAEILRAVPQARLSVKTRGLEEPATRERYAAMFDACGVDRQRITFSGPSPLRTYFEGYNDIDIALDPFPFNGGTTTVDGLWMGVPAVSLVGERWVSRMGLTHLTAVGLADLAVNSPPEYVRTAVALASDTDRLGTLRAGLRQRLLASPLCNAPHFTRSLEALYRDMWVTWCRSRDSRAVISD
jgi:protein O-GlcNAc transferase